MDRGYWRGYFLWKLKHERGVDFATLTRDDDFDFVNRVDYYLRGVEPTFEEKWTAVKKRGKKKKKAGALIFQVLL